MLLQCVDTVEHEFQQLGSIAMPQHSNSCYNNQLATDPQKENPEETHGDWEMVPMEIEDNEPNHGEIHKTPDDESVI